MRCFCALIWNPDNEAASRAAARIISGFPEAYANGDRLTKQPGFVLCDLSRGKRRANIRPLDDSSGRQGGAVFGAVFGAESRAPNSPTEASLSPHAVDAIVESDGQFMIDRFWGHYVAFVRTERGVHVILEPTASIPCFYMRQDGVTVVFSHLELCGFLNRASLSINWKYISALLAYDKIRIAETGLNEVSELMGGQRLTVSNDRMETEYLWDPRTIAANVYEPDFATAAERVRAIVNECVRCWALEYESFLLDLSGGVDSSSLLGAFAEVGEVHRVTPIHYVSGGADAPELRYARAAAEHAGRELLTHCVDASTTYPDVDAHPLTPRPYRNFLNLGDADFRTEVGKKLGVDAFLTGEGGDHLFLQTRSSPVFADYLKNHGIDRGMGRALIDATRLSRLWIGKVAWDGALATFGRRENRFVTALKDRKNDVNLLAHGSLDRGYGINEWLKDPKGLPPAKFDHVGNLIHMAHTREPFGRCEFADVVHPFISQPIVELCLRIPTYLHLTGGVTRGLAREAFKGQMAEVVRRRMTKGSTTRHHGKLISENLELLTTSLADGELARQGLIDRDAVLNYVSSDNYSADEGGKMLPVYYAIEAWVRSWKGVASNAAEAA